MKKLITLLALSISTNAFATSWWLNIPGHYSPITDEYVPPISWITTSQDSCSDAIVAYAKDNLVNYIGCDVKPLANAVNISPRFKNYYRD